MFFDQSIKKSSNIKAIICRGPAATSMFLDQSIKKASNIKHQDGFITVDLLYPKRAPVGDRSGNIGRTDDDDDRGKDVVPDLNSIESTENYEVKGETFAVRPNESYRFFYMKDMTLAEAMFIKCFDSRGQGMPKGVEGLARCTPHTAFEDLETPESAPGRQSIKVLCLVFYE
ncbi:hypothetical protein DL98DRAFT_532979 [Cadophora sp. DSE1049]|nr:hypothetical protein DL98DRAFT_532979 [Cadophora sp. DSE1049]